MSFKKKSNKNPQAVQANLRAMQRGLATHLDGRPLVVAGETIPTEDAMGRVDQALVPFERADEAHAVFSEAVKAREAATPATLAFATDLEAAIRAAVGTTSPLLVHFGLTPKRTGGRHAKRSDASAEGKATTPPPTPIK